MCFNISPKLTFDELLSNLWSGNALSAKQMLSSSQNTSALHDMSLEEILRFDIQPLVYFKYKVLGKEKDDDPKKENIKKTDVFILREKIPAKKLPRKIAFPPGSAQQQEKEAND